jgi:hypothetical protein
MLVDLTELGVDPEIESVAIWVKSADDGGGVAGLHPMRTRSSVPRGIRE